MGWNFDEVGGSGDTSKIGTDWKRTSIRCR